MEWPLVFPQNRDDFSIAAELSTSTVIGLAWSPPGLGRFRRSLLAVLTSNLILSLWEPVGAKGQWARVAVVNHALHPSQGKSTELEGLDLRKSNIRSFSWCPPLQIPTPDYGGGRDLPAGPESRWGIHVLSVANDNNEVALMKVQRSAPSFSQPQQYRFEKLALCALEEMAQFPSACAGSLLRAALQLKTRVTSISCGPWLPVAKKDSLTSTTTVLAVLYGTQLRLLKATIAVSKPSGETRTRQPYDFTAELKDHTGLAAWEFEWASQPITGPLKWLHTVC